MSTPAGSPILTRDFLLVTTSSLLAVSGFSATLPLVPRFVEGELDGGKVAVGVAVGIFSISALLIRPLIGHLGDTRGRRLLIVAGCGLTGIAIAAHGLAGSLAALLVIRFVMGGTQTGFFVGSTTIVTDIAPPDQRGKATSWFGVSIYGGQALGPIVGETVESFAGFTGAFIAAGALMLLGGAVATALPSYRPEPTPTSAIGAPVRRRLIHRAALAPGAILALGIVSFIAFTAFMPLYVDERGLGRSAPIFALYALTVLVARFFGSSIPDRFGTVTTATGALVGVIAGMATLWAWPSTMGLIVGTLISALGGSILFPALLVSAVHNVPDGERTLATSTFTASFEVSAGIGAPILGLAAAAADTSAAAFGVAALSAAIALPVLHLWLGRSPQAIPGTN